MKKLFLLGILGLILFEIANVYFIMPMPGSQQMNSINLAYFLFRFRWIFRGFFAMMLFIGWVRSDWKRNWVPILPIILVAAIIFITNFVMAADAMFQQPKQFIMTNVRDNHTDTNRLVIGISINGEAKAYPIQYIGYHHHIQDSIAGKPILVTYCTVCRTGRVYEPIVHGQHEQFRLVGMDHFNAMIEDHSTKTWWRQATGEAIAGKLKGEKLPELTSIQTSLAKWITLYPNTLIMQADPSFSKQYDSTLKYESGKSKSKLTGTDSLSWNKKSWVAGISIGSESKAYDWNHLATTHLIEDTLNQVPILIVSAKDHKSFFAFERPSAEAHFRWVNDTLFLNEKRYQINGKPIDDQPALKIIPVYQEFWHSWQSFHPSTRKE